VFRKLNLSDDHIQQYHSLNSLENEVFYWSDGVCRILRYDTVDPYTHWLATTDATERKMKRRMKERFGNNRDAIEELARVAEGCETTEERLSKLRTYFEKPKDALDI